MATAKKTTKPAVKKAPAKTAPKATAAPKETVPKYMMPKEVSNWIDTAMSTINHLKGEVERLKAENKDLKAYKKWAEHRILRSDYE